MPSMFSTRHCKNKRNQHSRLDVNFQNNTIAKLFNIPYPIIQAGMVYCSGGDLAAAAAESGCLGLIGAGSMDMPLLERQIAKALKLTDKPIGINIPLLYEKAGEQIDLALRAGIKIFFTSAGTPKTYTSKLKKERAIVVHVTSNPKLAIKCRDAGVDAVVAEGFEAGGHNGRDEITTMALIPQICDAIDIPVIAAGGIADGRQMAAAFCLGAAGVQMGTRFAATRESSAHDNFKRAIVGAKSGDTRLMMKPLVPVRLLDNEFSRQVADMESRGADAEEMRTFLGKGRARRGMLDGDMKDGELEIGQVSAMIRDIPSCQELVRRLLEEYRSACENISIPSA